MAGTVGILILVALIGALGVGSATSADAAAPQSASSTAPNGPATITISGVEVGGLMELSATLTSPDAHPVADAQVEFLISTTEFGTPARQVALGSVTTDKTGIARLTLGGDVDHLYRPTTNGPQEFLATYAAAGANTVTASTSVTVTAARSAYHSAPPRPLAGVGKGLVGVLFTIVAAIWLTLATLVWRVRRVCGRVQPTTTSNL